MLKSLPHFTTYLKPFNFIDFIGIKFFSARDPAAQQAGDADAVLRAEALDRQVADEIEHRDQHHHQPDLVEIP